MSSALVELELAQLLHILQYLIDHTKSIIYGVIHRLNSKKPSHECLDGKQTPKFLFTELCTARNMNMKRQLVIQQPF
jgi:hypothetical protein